MTLPEAPDPLVAAPGGPGQTLDADGPPRPSRASAVLDGVLRLAGAVLSVLLALLTAVAELMLVPLTVRGVPVGAAALVAPLANLALSWFAHTTVGRRRAVALPWLAWTLLMFVAAGLRTDEGDHLLPGDSWVGMLVVLLGSLAFAGYLYRLILRGQPER